MNIEDVKDFFNYYASSWDDDMVIDEDIINKILDDANVKEDSFVLDVATGTGVLVPFYLKRNIKQVVGVDVSEKMIEIANSKFNDHRVKFECRDVNDLICDNYFDSIVIYNAFPHFDNSELLINNLSKMLKEKGRLVIAHGASKETINKHHSGVANKISKELISGEELKKIMSKYLRVINIIDNDLMYEVTGEK